MILFRGQRTDKPLLPKIARSGINEPISKSEQKMFDELKKKAVPLLEYKPETEWDWLALAQHHGMATRLLDWTKNPLVALWHTVKEPPEKNGQKKELNGVVWIYEPQEDQLVSPSDKESPFSPERIVVFQPSHITRRVVAQSGWFIVHKKTTDDGKIRPFEETVRGTQHLKKLIICAKKFCDMRYQLDRVGINEASIYPDLSGLCNNIQWLNSLLEDEAEVCKNK